MLMVAIASGAMVVWISERTRAHIERVELAQASYEAHLRLESHSYQLFKQFGDAIMIGDGDRGAGERELTALIRNDIRTIRAIIADEIQAVGEEEVEELELLADIENQLEELFDKFQRLTATVGSNDIALRWGEFQGLLDGEIDGEFRARINAALEEEQEEVAETAPLSRQISGLPERLA